MSYLFEILPSLLNGASTTVQVFALVLLFSIPLGVLIAFALQVHWKPLHYLINIYIWVMRGTPLLLQLIFIYYVLPSIGIRLDRLPAAIIAFVLNYAAYFAEIFRGGIDTIPRGQYEAAMLELRNINKVFGDKQILSNFSLSIPEKQILAIVGPSGGGKTTLLRMLAGLETIDSGQIFYNGQPLELDELQKRNLLGFVFQDFQLFPHLSVLENLTLSPVKTMGMKQEEAEKKASGLLEQLGLGGHAEAYPFSLSGGQKQRVALARAMMIDPEIIGYDEPTSALDPELRLEVEKLILQNRELGMTQIVVTHDLQFAENIADVLLKVEPK